MSLLDVAPIIEQMLLVSENVSDLNFSSGQKPPGRDQRCSLSGITDRPRPAVCVSDRDDRDGAASATTLMRPHSSQKPNRRSELRIARQVPFSRQYISAAKFVLDRDACHSARDPEFRVAYACRDS